MSGLGLFQLRIDVRAKTHRYVVATFVCGLVDPATVAKRMFCAAKGTNPGVEVKRNVAKRAGDDASHAEEKDTQVVVRRREMTWTKLNKQATSKTGR